MKLKVQYLLIQKLLETHIETLTSSIGTGLSFFQQYKWRELSSITYKVFRGIV